MMKCNAMKTALMAILLSAIMLTPVFSADLSVTVGTAPNGLEGTVTNSTLDVPFAKGPLGVTSLSADMTTSVAAFDQDAGFNRYGLMLTQTLPSIGKLGPANIALSTSVGVFRVLPGYDAVNDLGIKAVARLSYKKVVLDVAYRDVRNIDVGDGITADIGLLF